MIRPARPDDLYALLPLAGRHEARAMLVQMARSEAMTVEHEGKALAMAGLYPQADKAEAWFVLRKDAHNTAAGMWAAMQVIRAWRQLPVPIPVEVAVREGHGPGRRLAAMAGFKPSGQHGPLELFTLDRSA
jgi:hypothetical protein